MLANITLLCFLKICGSQFLIILDHIVARVCVEEVTEVGNKTLRLPSARYLPTTEASSS